MFVLLMARIHLVHVHLRARAVINSHTAEKNESFAVNKDELKL